MHFPTPFVVALAAVSVVRAGMAQNAKDLQNTKAWEYTTKNCQGSISQEHQGVAGKDVPLDDATQAVKLFGSQWVGYSAVSNPSNGGPTMSTPSCSGKVIVASLKTGCVPLDTAAGRVKCVQSKLSKA